LDIAGVGVGAISKPSVEVSSMILSRDAREFKCVRDRVRGRRRMSCWGEESGDACGRTAVGEDGEESDVWSIFVWEVGEGGRNGPEMGC